MKYAVILLPDLDAESEVCPICTGSQPARAFMVVPCFNCHKLTLHSRAEYSSNQNHEYHHYCRYCEAMNIRSRLQENAGEILGERLMEYGYESLSRPEENWRARFADYLEAHDLPAEWND